MLRALWAPAAGGRSRNWSTGKEEAGVSVLHGQRLPDGEARATPRNDVQLGSALPLEGWPPYIATGTVVGVGSDGEPVLDGCEAINANKTAPPATAELRRSR